MRTVFFFFSRTFLRLEFGGPRAGRKDCSYTLFFCEVSVLHARVQGCSSLVRGKTTGKVLRASPHLAVAPSYLRELEDENVAFADLPTMLDLGMNRVDVRLFAAIVGACPKKHQRPQST